jgi:hypothetical protein
MNGNMNVKQGNKLSSNGCVVIRTIFSEYANTNASGFVLLFVRKCHLNEILSDILTAILIGTICVPNRRNRPIHRTANCEL